ncbi:hypothetical protein DXG01_002004, partial [Tephrocybe rancida]
QVVERLVRGVPGAYQKKFPTWELAVAKYRQRYDDSEVEARILVREEHEATTPVPIESVQLGSEPTIAERQHIIDTALDKLITL